VKAPKHGCWQWIIDCLLPTAYCLLPTAYCLLGIGFTEDPGQFEEDTKMPYVARIERRGNEQGTRQVIREGAPEKSRAKISSRYWMRDSET